MKWPLLLVCVVVVWTASSAGANSECAKPSSLIYRSPGNVTITGIFNAHFGEECNLQGGKGLEQIAAAVWTISLLNSQNFIPGIQIGTSMFDACGAETMAQRSLVQASVLENCEKHDTTSLGTITSQEIRLWLDPLAQSLNKTISSVGNLLERRHLLSMITSLLQGLFQNTIHRVIADSDIIDDFGRLTAKEGICIYDQVTIDDIHAINNDVLLPPNTTDSGVANEAQEAPVIVVISSSSKIWEMFRQMSANIFNMSDILWILAPTDSVVDIPSDQLPHQTYILSAVMPKPDELEDLINSSALNNVPLIHRKPIKSPFFISIASKILKILKPIKYFYDEHCSNENDTCSELSKYLESYKISNTSDGELKVETISEIINTLNLPFDEEMTLFSVSENLKSNDIALFKIYSPETQILKPVLLLIEEEREKRAIVRVGVDDILRSQMPEVTTVHTTEKVVSLKAERPPEKKKTLLEKHPCYQNAGDLSKSCGICQNFIKYLSKVAQEKQMELDELKIGWRFETWVGINASVATIGVLCAIAILIFISVRIAVGDVLEGNPILSYILLLSIILTYVTTLTFGFETSGAIGDSALPSMICDLRVLGPPICYSLMFSIIFARSLMLAASDQDGGFMSHVNGYLQAVIIFFVFAVQVAISTEYWMFNSFQGDPTASCQSMYDSNRFIILMSYNFFLLLLLLAVTPFMCRSKRNYREGVFFSIAISLVILLWCTWISLYYVLPATYRDAIVTFGLTATATAILVCVFISRTYLMTTAIVRDRIVNTLPPLTHPDANYRSTVTLYDAVNLHTKVGVPNPNFYAMNPSDPPTPQILPGQYYSSNNGLKAPTPEKTLKVPPVRRSPEPVYDAYDSPVQSPARHVTRF